MKIYSWIIIGLLTILCVRLAVVQLFYNETYQTQAKENRIRLLSIKPPRGEIYAANGEVLAANQLVYTLTFSPVGVEDKEKVISSLVEVVKKYYPDITVESIQEKIVQQQYRLFEPIVIMRDIPWEFNN